MTVHIPPGYAQASIEHWLAGFTRPAVTTMGLKILGTTTGGTNIADLYWSAYTESFLVQFDNNVTVRNARVVVGQDGGEPLVFTSARSDSGSVSRESTAPALAFMLNKNTDLGGRANRGRMYLPWALGDTSVADNGAITPSVLDTWAGLADTFMGFLTNEGGGGALIEAPVLLHSDLEREPTTITSMVPNPTIRTQRRRQGRY